MHPIFHQTGIILRSDEVMTNSEYATSEEGFGLRTEYVPKRKNTCERNQYQGCRSRHVNPDSLEQRLEYISKIHGIS